MTAQHLPAVPGPLSIPTDAERVEVIREFDLGKHRGRDTCTITAHDLAFLLDLADEALNGR